MGVRNPAFFRVAKDTPVGQCRSCRAPIFWIETQKGKRMPVDTRVEGGIEPATDRDGRGMSHFATCPTAHLHRKPRDRQVATVQPAPPSLGAAEQRHCDRKAGSDASHPVATSRLVSPEGVRR